MELTKPYIDLLPPLTTEETERLRLDIEENGVINPVLITEDGRVLDGHNRLSIKPDAPTKKIKGSAKWSDDECVAFVLKTNLHRRNLSPDQKRTVREKMIILAREMKLRTNPRTGQPYSQDAIGKLFGVPRQTVDNWLDDRMHIAEISNMHTPDSRIKIPKSEYPKILERIEAGETQSQIAADYGVDQGTISRTIDKERRRREVEATKENPPGEFNGLYDVAVIDPPWEMKKIERDVAPNQADFDYLTMGEDQLKELQFPLADHCHVWVWTTHKHLPMCFRLLEAWDLKYVCTFVWHKPGGFQPFGMPQLNCEFALYARKGTPTFTDLKDFKLCFDAKRGKHSEKPEEFYDLVRRVTSGRRIDIFNRRSIDGFDTWGKEARQ